MNDAWEDEEEEEVAPRPIRRRRSTRSEQRGNLYLLTGLLMGLALGVAYAWLVSPVQYVDNVPQSLAAPYKDEYRRLIALAYASDKNLGRARERLALLETGGSVQILASQAQRMLAENQPPQEARALALLAADLGRPQGASAAPGETSSPQAVASGDTTETPVAEITLEPTSATEVSAAIQTPTLPPPTRTPTITNTPPPTFTPRPTSTPLPVQDAPFVMKSKREACAANDPPALVQIQVTDADEKPLPGVQILIIWQNGEDTLYTGLAPEIGPGYADFLMAAGMTYNIKVGEASKVVGGITIPGCGGGWKLEFSESTRD